MTKSIAQIRADLAEWLGTHDLQHGVGNKKSACSVAAMNIADSGCVTDVRPDCMCPVLHGWIIPTQDFLPLGTGPYDLNGPRWKSALILAAGTNDGRGAERKGILMDWMWGVVLPQMQPVADRYGFGGEWRHMSAERTMDAAMAAAAFAPAALTVAGAQMAMAHAVSGMAFAAALSTTSSTTGEARAAAWAAEALNRTPAYFAAIDAPGLLERLVNLPERSAA